MKTAQKDFPQMHLFWYSANRGFSNDDGTKKRIYFGKIFRIPKDTEDGESIEQRELEDLQVRFINSSCAEDGDPVVGETFERYDVFDPDTGDMIVLYRVPYRLFDEQTVDPPTVLPPLSRHARRAAAKQGELKGGVLPVPPNASQEARRLTVRLLHLLDKHAPDKAFKLPATLAAEQRALALMTVAAHELSSMPQSPQRQAIITQMGAFLGWLVVEADKPPSMPAFSEEDLDELVEQGIAESFDPGTDDTDKTH